MPTPLTRLQTSDELLNRIQDRLVQGVNAAIATPLVWIDVGLRGGPAFMNAWVNFDSNDGSIKSTDDAGNSFTEASRNAGFTKDTFGWVTLRGIIKSGTTGKSAFTLPTGYRPKTNKLFPVVSNGAFGDVTVYSNGEVRPAQVSSVYVSLDGIRFLADATG